MRGYVAFSWASDDAEAVRRASQLRRDAGHAGYVAVEMTRTSWVGIKGPCPPALQRPRQGELVIGDLFAFGSTPLPAGPREDLQAAGWYIRNRWGRYVVLFRDSEGGFRSAFRDPSGALAAILWTANGVRICASETEDWMFAGAPTRLSFDWDAVARLVASPFDLRGSPPVQGLTILGAGEHGAIGQTPTTVWSAVEIGAPSASAPRSGAGELRERLDACVGAMGRNSRLGVELSGGLDSAIVAGAARAMELPIVLTLNTRGPQPETDERRFATMMANWIGLPLEVRLRQEVVFTAEAFEATAGDPWPSQNGRDLANDLTVVEACRSAGVDRLLTGKGGDALFFQMHTPLTFADLWRRRPIQALLSPALPGVARWTRSSTWSVLRASRHALQDLKVHDLSPGKRMQIAAIESGLAYYSRCLRSDVVDMVHPLMSQPLIEWALRTPVPDLTPGGQERGLARRVFADRLPEAIANRRAKGDYAAYFNQQTAANLPFLRDYLLGGRLADQSVFDRADMEARLVPDRLLWRGGAAEILAAVSTEAWVRRWEARMTAGR